WNPRRWNGTGVSRRRSRVLHLPWWRSLLHYRAPEGDVGLLRAEPRGGVHLFLLHHSGKYLPGQSPRVPAAAHLDSERSVHRAWLGDVLPPRAEVTRFGATS